MSETCQACSSPAPAAHSPCCSSHGKPLCCTHYCRFHFVEVNQCTPDSHQEARR